MKFLRQVKDGTVDLGNKVLQKPASKIFAKTANASVKVAGGARKQLDDALDAWAMNDATLTLPPTYRTPHSSSRDPILSALEAIHSVNDDGVVNPNRGGDEMLFAAFSTAKRLAREGDYRAAYIVGITYELGKNYSAALPYYLRSALGGYVPAARGVGSALWSLGQVDKALDWATFAAGRGNASARKQIVFFEQTLRARPDLRPSRAPAASVASPSPSTSEPTRSSAAPRTASPTPAYCGKIIQGPSDTFDQKTGRYLIEESQAPNVSWLRSEVQSIARVLAQGQGSGLILYQVKRQVLECQIRRAEAGGPLFVQGNIPRDQYNWEF